MMITGRLMPQSFYIVEGVIEPMNADRSYASVVILDIA